MDIIKLQPLTVNALLSYLYTWYSNASEKKMVRANLPIKTVTLHRKSRIILTAVREISKNFTPLMESQFKFKVDNLISSINRKFHMVHKYAPYLGFEDMEKISDALWTANPSGRGYRPCSKWLRQAASVICLLSAYAGGRWGDICETFWDDITIKNQENGEFWHIYLRTSKNNRRNEQAQCLTFKRQVSRSGIPCPIQRLLDYKLSQNNPKSGRIFPGATTKRILRVVQEMAINMNITRPTGHSGRVSMATTLQGANVPTETIMAFMNWKTPRMPNAYANIRAQRMDTAPAALITDRDKILKIQRQLF